MNRDHQPCVTCHKFNAREHYCRGHERAQAPDGEPCPLHLERGSKAARLADRCSVEVLADLRRRHPEETISRVSASTAAPTRKATP